MEAISLNAHFDGERIVLDEPLDLAPDTKLIVTVVPTEDSDQARDDWLRLSTEGLARAYGDDEPEHTIDTIKEPNPEYKQGDLVVASLP